MKLCIIIILVLIILYIFIILNNLISLKRKIKKYSNELNSYKKRKNELVLEILNSKANSNIMRLQHELKEIEIKLSSLNHLYNDNLIIYNSKINKFPISLIASLFGLKKIC